MNIQDFPVPPPSPEWQFVRELSAEPEYRFTGVPMTPPAGSIAIPDGFLLIDDFPDPEELLQSAVNDLKRLLSVNRLDQGTFPVHLEFHSTDVFESYRISVSATECKLSAGDTEGMRRAVYEFMEMVETSCGTWLPAGEINRRPWLKTRISRCFYSPTKRGATPNDELADDVDYYPDEYLNRLARDGVNGLWLVVAFSELAKTSFTPGAPDLEKRLEKLRKTVRKCLRYGIKTYIFAIEPFGRAADDPLCLEHPEMFGAEKYSRRCFCPSSPETRQYLRECTRYIFSHVPGLGGLITITHGERPTTCLSAVDSISDIPVPCPRCAELPKGDIIRQSLSAIRAGIDDAAPDALFISWFYMPWTAEIADWAMEIGSSVPKGVIAQFNFESGGREIQLGREHIGGDYWLSYAGPSERFIRQTAHAQKAGVQVSAKLQIGCCHELGTVPLIPVPGILRQKFRKMRELGVSHAMLCWYLGNYPGIMSRAAGKLAFDDFQSSEDTFLQFLAQPAWNNAASAVAEAWRLFSNAYRNLPFSVVSQYYAPQNAGVVWALSPLPYLKALAPPWRADFTPGGDNIGEALAAFSIEEEITLFRTMHTQWQRGLELLDKAMPHARSTIAAEQESTLAKALALIMESSANILEFYRQRDLLFNDGSTEALPEMRTLAARERKISLEMAELCEKDSRLGFHSEAMCHCFHPASLKWRAAHLQEMLDGIMQELEKHCTGGKSPWEFFLARPDAPIQAETGVWQQHDRMEWKLDADCNAWRIIFKYRPFREFVLYITDSCGISFPSWIRCVPDANGTSAAIVEENLYPMSGEHNVLFNHVTVECSGDLAIMTLPVAALPPGRFFRLNLYASDCDGIHAAYGSPYPYRLCMASYSAEDAALLEK